MPEYRVNQLEAVLRALHESVEGLQGTVVVSLDGFVVAAHLPSGNGRREHASSAADSPQVAAMAASIIALSDKVLAQLARGSISRVLIDGSEGGIIVVPAGAEAALAVMVDHDAKLGLVMLVLQRSAEQVKRILAR
ncbi:MAG TPA: roadblock/LC7 domain-containing protein [Anaerolineae bacterium]|nr:roadblock/LC7 domain-containing protein [Anaerolineae bacterium]